MQVKFDAVMKDESYGFITFLRNPKVKLHFSAKRVTGLLSVFNAENKAVSNYGKQTPTEDIGVDEFEFWCPKRRPEGQNIAFKYEQGINAFQAGNIANGIDRPVAAPNAWVADWNDPDPTIYIHWKESKTIKRIALFFDTDYDHPMESVLMGHPENIMPFCVRDYSIKDDTGGIVIAKKGNYQTRNVIELAEPLNTKSLTISLVHPSDDVPAALFSVRCY